jgi:cytochrome c-type biogenesis protein CcmH
VLLTVLGLVLSVGLGYWISSNWIFRFISMAVFAAATLVYSAIGVPALQDQPLSQRLADIREKDPQQVKPEEWIALLTERARLEPDNPEPYKFMGDVYFASGATEQAILSYEGALRRDGRYFPVLLPLADALVRHEGARVSDRAYQIYKVVFETDPSQVRAAFMPGMKHWLSGDREAARAWWRDASTRMDEGSAEQTEFLEQVAMLEAAMANVARPDTGND